MKCKKIIRFFIIGVLIFISFSKNAVCLSYFECNSEITNQENSNIIDFKNYYYNQLNDVEKTIYKNLMNSREKFLNGEEVIFVIQPYDENNKLNYLYYLTIIRRACRAYTYENPEVEIWFEHYQKSYFHQQNYTYLVLKPKDSAESNTNLNSENIKEEIIEFENIALDFVSTLSGTDEEKLKQIHDWLIKRSIYDKTLVQPNTRNAYGAIVEKRSICSGFAYAFKYIADLANLNVLYVTGKTYDSNTKTFTPHAWNIVYVNGEYLLVDVTFDNPSNYKPQSTFLFSPINDQKHYIDHYYFNYSF